MDELDDDELAWLMAHEFAHLRLRHSDQAKEEIQSTSEELFESLKSDHRRRRAKGHGRIRRSLSTAARGGLGVAAMLLLAKGSSREHEDEADDWACEVTWKADFDPEAGVGVIKKVHSGRIPRTTLSGLIWSTHPDPSQRIQRIARIASEYR